MAQRLRRAVPADLGPGRTDGDIFGEARTALDNRPDIPETVHVHVAGGVATLTGTVRLPGEQRLAEDIVRRVNGVRQVINKTTLAQPINVEGLEPPQPD
jgi:osmotically-inducible protein OsmY